MKEKIGFYGAGSMAEAIIAGMTATEMVPAEQIMATNHSNRARLAELENKYGIQTTSSKQEIMEQNDIIILAMKPKDIKSVTAEIKKYLTADKIIVSLLAGISTSFIEQQLATNNPIVRVMPNTSATIGQSATTITAGQYAMESHVHLIYELVKSIGTVSIIDEAEMDAYTALAGSGPAFYYYMVEAMEQFATEKNMDPHVAKSLMVQTLKGVTEMIDISSDSPKILREKITSPGGTTEAGLKKLADYDFQKAVLDCLSEATNRSKELRKQFEK